VHKEENNFSFEREETSWDDNIKIDLKGIGCGGCGLS
jgi:hypothetical protein